MILARQARTIPLLVVLAAPAIAVARPGPWAQLTDGDVSAIQQLLRDSHPGAVDPLDPAFRRWLDDGAVQARARARTVTTPAGYESVLRRYVAGFRDGHLSLSIALGHPALQWPGFVVALRAQRYRVHFAAAEPELPPVGAELVGCDGSDAATLMRRELFASAGDPALEASWIQLAPGLLVDDGDPLRSRPRACIFRVGDELRTLPLRWRAVSEAELRPHLVAARFGRSPPLGLRELADGSVWISLPTFAPEGDEPAGLTRIIERLPALRSRPLLVFDVRGNDGGNSEWGQRLVEALYGPAWTRAAEATMAAGGPIAVDWRASPGNQRHVRELVGRLEREFGRDAANTRELGVIATGLEATLAAHRPYYHEADDEAAAAAPVSEPPPPPDVRARVVLLTDGRCASACLDFAALLVPHANVVQAGSSTSADTPYMEVRAVPLPSGLAVVRLPIKVFRHRARDHRPFVPALRYDGDLGDTDAVERWLRAALATRRADP